MSANDCNQPVSRNYGGSGFLIVVVLYILLAIMFSSFIGC